MRSSQVQKQKAKGKSKSYYPWKEAGDSGWSKILERMKRHGLQSEIQAWCQVLWEPILREPNHRNRLLSATSLSWKTSTPQIYYCSVSILHPAIPQPNFPVLGGSYLTLLWVSCVQTWQQNPFLALQLCLWVWPKSYAWFLQGLGSGSAVFPKGSNILPWDLGSKTAPASSQLQRLVLYDEYSSEPEAWSAACLVSQSLCPG